jgi:hypothetical protein
MATEDMVKEGLERKALQLHTDMADQECDEEKRMAMEDMVNEGLEREKP